MAGTPNVAIERAWKLLALALVGVAVVLVNFDPVVNLLPDIPQGGGLPVSETAKQSLALAVGLLILAIVVAALVVRRPGSASAVSFAGVVGSSAVAALVVFLIVLALAGDNRQVFALATLVVVGVAAIAALFGRPAFSFANLSAKPVVAVIAAVVLILGYGLILNHMFSRAGTDNADEWARMVALFAGVEAIAFAAVGAILGSEVQKAQTTAETQRADQNRQLGNEIADRAQEGTEVPMGMDTESTETTDPTTARIQELRRQLR